MKQSTLNFLLPTSCSIFLACGGVIDEQEFADSTRDQCACGQLGARAESADDQNSADTARSTSGLYGNRNYFWPAAASYPPSIRTDVPICWENPESTSIGANATARATWRDARRRALEESWARHARINFVGWGTCTNGGAGVHIVICDGLAWNGSMWIRQDARCPALPFSQAGGGYPTIYGLNNGIRLNPDHSAAVVVHEIGHALGYYHEEERFNTTQDLPTTACDTSGGSGWTNPNPATYGSYDLDSIMAYCSPPPGAPWLSYNDVSGIQRTYGTRIAGSLVSSRANCAAAHAAVGSGDPAFLWDCDEFANDQEYYDVTTWSNGDAWNLQLLGSNLCLEPLSNTAGSNVTLWTCSSGSTNYDWRLESMFVRGFGGLCLDLANGNTSAGTAINVWECGALGGANQRWTRTRAGQLRYGTSNMCAAVNSATLRLNLATCNTGDSTQLFTFEDGRIRRANNNAQCLDVLGPSDAQYAVNGTSGWGLPSNGAPVQQFNCNTALNQRWVFSGALRTGANANLCLARWGDSDGAGLSLASCTGDHETQEWDYVF